jgi:hypothetical protein
MALEDSNWNWFPLQSHGRCSRRCMRELHGMTSCTIAAEAFGLHDIATIAGEGHRHDPFGPSQLCFWIFAPTTSIVLAFVALSGLARMLRGIDLARMLRIYRHCLNTTSLNHESPRSCQVNYMSLASIYRTQVHPQCCSCIVEFVFAMWK